MAMMRMPGTLLMAACLLNSFPVMAETESVRCTKSAAFLAPFESSDYRKYAPDYRVKMRHLALDVTPDFKHRSLRGTAKLRFTTLLEPVREVQFDAVQFDVRSVTASEKLQGYQATADQLTVTFARELPPGKEVTVTVEYQVEPKRGLYFRTPEMGYKAGDAHVFSQGEEIEGRNWYPSLDAPSSLLTSEITCHVPEGMTVISNGRLIATNKEASGKVAFHFSQEQPHANYLITLVAGYFQRLDDKRGKVPLSFYVPVSENPAAAANSFRGTREMIDFFEKETGVPYPWAKYDQVCVNDFVAGGMENTSATTLTDRTLFLDETENIETSESLVAHELAHQWFGDLVTCKDWSHTWLNEGFATYYETLFTGHQHGRDDFLYSLWRQARTITEAYGEPQPVVRRTFDSPGQMFSHLSYDKGGWILHMLHAQLGDELFRKCVHQFLDRHRHQNVVTEDLRRILEELSGRPFDQFFDQWLYHAHHPELEVSYSWNEPLKQARLDVRQTQKLSTNVLLFNVPLPVRFTGKFGKETRTVQVSKKEEQFLFNFKSAPTLVRIDPEVTLLARIRFQPPPAMLKAQGADESDLPGRLLAAESLGKQGGADAIVRLKRMLNEDKFYGVRIEASTSLRGIHSDEALEALLASAKQPDARVRSRVVEDIGAFYRESAYRFAQDAATKEKNPEILGRLLTCIAGYAKPEIRDQILARLASSSYRNQLADAAIAAARLQDDPSYVQPLLRVLSAREADFTSSGFGQGLSAVAYLARNEKDEQKKPVREFLLRHVNSRKRPVQMAALRGLGTLGDPRALAAVEKFTKAKAGSGEKEAAEETVRLLRASRRPVDDFKNLREQVLELQKQSRELQKEVEDLKKKSEAPRSEERSELEKTPEPATSE